MIAPLMETKRRGARRKDQGKLRRPRPHLRHVEQDLDQVAAMDVQRRAITLRCFVTKRCLI